MQMMVSMTIDYSSDIFGAEYWLDMAEPCTAQALNKEWGSSPEKKKSLKFQYYTGNWRALPDWRYDAGTGLCVLLMGFFVIVRLSWV
jgi:hypothetical protein